MSIINRDAHDYYDKRSEFWEKYFDAAHCYEDYLKSSIIDYPSDVERWNDSMNRIPELTSDQEKRLQGFNRELNVLMYSGVWCGDCVRQGPLLKRIVDSCDPTVNLRFIERNFSKELQDELRIVGALRVPMVVFLSEDFWEIERYGERTLSVYRSKAAREVGRGVDQGILVPSARKTELEEWLDVFERVLIMLRLSPPLRRRYSD